MGQVLTSVISLTSQDQPIKGRHCYFRFAEDGVEAEDGREVQGRTLRDWNDTARRAPRVLPLPCGTYSQICLMGRRGHKTDTRRV